MAEFKVELVTIDKIIPIENADFIEVAQIGGYQSIVQKGMFNVGDLAVYIPEASLIPEWLIEELELTGKLAGSKKNRVRAVKLRGVLSQGVLYDVGKPKGVFDAILKTEQGQIGINKGENVAEALGIKKYESPIPVAMHGQVTNIGSEYTKKYDIENVKKYMNVLSKDDHVTLTEKIHGIFMMVGRITGEEIPHADEILPNQTFVASKGLGGQGLVFKNNIVNENNLYLRAYRQLLKDDQDIIDVFHKATNNKYANAFGIIIMGEVFGSGVQDLTYGMEQNQIGFRIFDIYVGSEISMSDGRYLDQYDELDQIVPLMNEINTDIKQVPILYRGPFDFEEIDRIVQFPSEFDKNQIMEGVVIKPMNETCHPELGRVILKHVGEKYLTRKGGTEYN